MIFRSKWVCVVALVSLSIGSLGLLSSCEGKSGKKDGTITVRVTGAGTHNGKGFLCAVVSTGDDPSDLAKHIAESCGSLNQTIAAGTVEEIMGNPSMCTTRMTFSGGESYDVGGIIDVDGDKVYASSVDDVTDPVRTVEVDGDTILEFVYPTDFILAP